MRRPLVVVFVAVLVAACSTGDASTGDASTGDASTGETGSDDPSPGDVTGSVAASVPSPTTPTQRTVPASAPGGVEPEGFSTITARITDADGEVCEVCVWLADAADERGRGLMGVTDLGDAAGMVFRFDAATRGSFFMLNTPTPLSIAWFGTDGDYVESTDMDPCLEVPEGGCPLYGPSREYQLALEVFRGGLPDLGVGPGARLELLAGTESDRCP